MCRLDPPTKAVLRVDVTPYPDDACAVMRADSTVRHAVTLCMAKHSTAHAIAQPGSWRRMLVGSKSDCSRGRFACNVCC